MSWSVVHGDCVERMAAMDAASVDAVVCDPPYGLEFMGKEWDRLGGIGKAKNRGMSSGRFKGMVMPESYNADANVKCRACGRWKKDHAGRKCVCDAPDFPNVKAHQARAMQEWHHAWACEALRVLKPGGHLVAFGGSRTYHRMASGIEDAGFEIRDQLQWLYGSGFPKSLDVSKAIDKAAGAEREVVGTSSHASGISDSNAGPQSRDTDFAWANGKSVAAHYPITAPATKEAVEWDGWGTALKPAHEPIVLARKPLIGTVVANVFAHGTGALNIDGTRIAGVPRTTHTDGNRQGTAPHPMSWGEQTEHLVDGATGRWPANVILDEEAGAMLDAQAGDRGGGPSARSTRGGGSDGDWNPTDRESSAGQTIRGGGEPIGYGDLGGASRFFYCPKASASERHAGATNNHPTVKPVDLMRWLVRLVTPPGGMVLDPFTGSGTTGMACVWEGCDFVGIEQDEGYVQIAKARIEQAGRDQLDATAQMELL